MAVKAKQQQPELSDDWHLDEPLAYLVKCHNDCVMEYRVFVCEAEARRFAEAQERILPEDEDESRDSLIYPLYAGHGRTRHERKFS